MTGMLNHLFDTSEGRILEGNPQPVAPVGLDFRICLICYPDGERNLEEEPLFRAQPTSSSHKILTRMVKVWDTMEPYERKHCVKNLELTDVGDRRIVFFFFFYRKQVAFF